jgi:hypothetical protein
MHMNKAQEILRQNGVEIDLGDHRPAEEIVIALGLTAALTEAASSQVVIENTTEEMKLRRPYFVK